LGHIKSPDPDLDKLETTGICPMCMRKELIKDEEAKRWQTSLGDEPEGENYD